jgi:hypothetical protein
VTQGECDFLSGLTPGSYYYSSATGFLSVSVGDYEVGVAKSATNLLMLERIAKVNKEFVEYLDTLFAAKATPSYTKASFFDFWKTREIKTTSGTFTVPAGVYYLGIACVGKGGNGAPSNNGVTQVNWAAGGGGGGLSFSVLKVVPGQQIPYTISAGVAQAGGMIANPGSNATWNVATGSAGGTASGGDYNYTGGDGGSSSGTSYAFGGGGGAGGGAGGTATSSSGYMSHGGGGGGRAFPDNTSWTPGAGGSAFTSGGIYYAYAGGGSPRFAGGSASAYSGTWYGTPATMTYAGESASNQVTNENQRPGLVGSSILKMGLAVCSDVEIPLPWPDPTYSPPSAYFKLPFGHSNIGVSTAASAAFGGGSSSGGWAGFGGGQGGNSSQYGSGVLGGGGSGGGGTNSAGYGGGGGGYWGTTVLQGGASVVIFIY